MASLFQHQIQRKWLLTCFILLGMIIKLPIASAQQNERSASEANQKTLQQVRIRFTEKGLRSSLPGVCAQFQHLGNDSLRGSGCADEEGVLRLKLPVGPYKASFKMVGYAPLVREDIQVTSGKALLLDIELEASEWQTEAVEVAAQQPFEMHNEMALLSARSFRIEETKRYAGSRDDIGRMVTAFAGVSTADDSRNDIVVRGNSPTGVLWRVEGLEVPNPSHFALIGTTGGPVTMLNNKVLRNSDFYTGAFPAEFANAQGAVFDVRLRHGNNEKFEVTGQAGMLGLEAVVEGPLGKSGASFLMGYRYATLGLINRLGLNFGAAGTPIYQDFNMKLHFPQKDGTVYSAYLLWGNSDYSLLNSERDTTKWSFGTGNTDIVFGTRTTVAGFNILKPISKKTNAELKFNTSFNRQHTGWDTLNFVQGGVNKVPVYRAEFNTQRHQLGLQVNHRLNNKWLVQEGLLMAVSQYLMRDSSIVRRTGRWLPEIDAPNVMALWWQGFVQARYTPSARWVFSGGVNVAAQTLAYSANQTNLKGGDAVIEPRFQAAYQLHETGKLKWGAGLHSQQQTPNILFQRQPFVTNDGSTIFLPLNMDSRFTRASHYLMGYEWQASPRLRFLTEVYYQHLYNIPIELQRSPIAAINQGADFRTLRTSRLSNSGYGENYGIELTAERAFDGNYYFMLNGSLFQSGFRASDGVWRNTQFNNQWVTNFLGGKEWRIGQQKTTTVGGNFRIAASGGRWFMPIDISLSQQTQVESYDFQQAYFQQHPFFARLDVRGYIRWNGKRINQELSLDLINATNRQNVLGQVFDFYRNRISTEYQLGFTPLLNYIVDF